MNQCDGCQAGIPLVNGMHAMGKPGGYPDRMRCTKSLYTPPNDCAEEGHSWIYLGLDDGLPCYRCRYCGKESC